MPTYTVQCFEGGVWNDQEPLDIDADNPRLAAEAVCGGSVRRAENQASCAPKYGPKAS